MIKGDGFGGGYGTGRKVCSVDRRGVYTVRMLDRCDACHEVYTSMDRRGLEMLDMTKLCGALPRLSQRTIPAPAERVADTVSILHGWPVNPLELRHPIGGTVRLCIFVRDKQPLPTVDSSSNAKARYRHITLLPVSPA
jgi:hypothetical protein